MAGMTTFELGGPARHFTEARNEDEVLRALRWAQEHGHATFVLGGGSNLVVADEGFDGLVIRTRLPGLRFETTQTGSTALTAGAGEVWDRVVRACVDRRHGRPDQIGRAHV